MIIILLCLFNVYFDNNDYIMRMIISDDRNDDYNDDCYILKVGCLLILVLIDILK